jgi:hypothetical protein
VGVGVGGFQVAAEHVSADSYDILAKTGKAVEVGQLRLMRQDLLAKRFRLVVHRESRMMPVYELVAAREGDGDATFALVQEELGLRVAAARALFDVIAIDSAEKPSGN